MFRESDVLVRFHVTIFFLGFRLPSELLLVRVDKRVTGSEETCKGQGKQRLWSRKEGWRMQE